MITENDVTDILDTELPGINKKLERLPASNNIYKAMQCFVDFTKELVTNGNPDGVKSCFNLAERMLKEGNNAVKNAVENVYVFSVSTALFLCTPISKELTAMFNGSLKNEYTRQVVSSGI